MEGVPAVAGVLQVTLAEGGDKGRREELSFINLGHPQRVIVVVL